MRESGPTPMERRYASVSLMPSSSRNWSASGPGTTPHRQVSAWSVVTAKVPAEPASQTAFWLTGLTAMKRAVVPLCCGVRTGSPWRAFWARTEVPRSVGDEVSEQPAAVAASAATTGASRSERRMGPPRGRVSLGCPWSIGELARGGQAGALFARAGLRWRVAAGGLRRLRSLQFAGAGEIVARERLTDAPSGAIVHPQLTSL